MAHIRIALMGALVLTPALAQDHHHPPQDAVLHDIFYSTWMRPDQPTVSCCNKVDCAPAEARMTSGGWVARRRNDTQWFRIPPEKIELNRDSPDGRSHLCAADKVFCFIAGTAG